MAGFAMIGDPVWNVEYSIGSGEPRDFTIGDEVLLRKWPGDYDGDTTEKEGWEERLAELVVDAGLNDARSQILHRAGEFAGFHAFVYWLAERGHFDLIGVPGESA